MVGHVFAHQHAGDHGLGHRVAAQPVEAVQIPAGRLAAGEEAAQRGRFAAVVGADAAHRVVLGRSHRNPLARRVDAEKVMADVAHLAQLAIDVGGAQAGDVEPQVLRPVALDALAAAHVLGHAARDHVARGELGLLGFVVGHEAVAVHVAQHPAVTATAFGDEDAGRHDGGGMELHRLHVAEPRHPGLERDRRADAFVDDGIGRHPVDAAIAAGGDHRGAGQPGRELAADQVAHHRALAAPAVVDQRNRLATLVHRDRLGHRAVAQRVQHGVTGAVRGIAGAPLAGAAEVAGGDQAVGLVALGEYHPLAIDDRLGAAALDAVPGHAPGRELAHRLGCHVGKHARHELVAAPVGAAHGVLEMQVLVVARAAHGVAEAGLHATLGSHRVRTLGGHQREDAHLQPAAARADRAAQPGEAAADHQHIGMTDLHRAGSARSQLGT